VTPRRAIRVNRAARAATAQARRALTRERLLDAAQAVIASKGLAGATIENFVKEAGVARGTFYNYFPTIADLVHALNGRLAARMGKLLGEIAARPAPPATRLGASLHAILAACARDPALGWVAFQLAGSSLPRQPAYEQAFAELYREGCHVGQFREVDLNAAFTVSFGAVRMAMRDVVAGAAPAQGVHVVALVLTALGLDFAEAERISREEAVLAQASPPSSGDGRTDQP